MLNKEFINTKILAVIHKHVNKPSKMSKKDILNFEITLLRRTAEMATKKSYKLEHKLEKLKAGKKKTIKVKLTFYGDVEAGVDFDEGLVGNEKVYTITDAEESIKRRNPEIIILRYIGLSRETHNVIEDWILSYSLDEFMGFMDELS